MASVAIRRRITLFVEQDSSICHKIDNFLFEDMIQIAKVRLYLFLAVFRNVKLAEFSDH